MNPMLYKLDQFSIESAIVVFETPKSKEVCLHAYQKFNPAYTFNCFYRAPIEFLLRGHFHLMVNEPPEPYSIYWDNYRQSMVRKLFIGILLALSCLLYLAITFGFTVALKEQFDSINYSTYCPKQYLYAKEENVKTN
mmetsp:Transcript_29496/g.44821  ORF Transcript_29496/g.44821 Transcript_29496/m.44821 type:complete len:137 (+) Transcript_29496:1109-1519(+)